MQKNKAKGIPARVRGKGVGKGEGKTVRCRIDLPPEVAAKLCYLAGINNLGFPDGIPDLVEMHEKGTLLLAPQKVGAPRARKGKGGCRVR